MASTKRKKADPLWTSRIGQSARLVEEGKAGRGKLFPIKDNKASLALVRRNNIVYIRLLS